MLEELLKQIIEGQKAIQQDVKGIKEDINVLKDSVQRIELHQEDTVMGMLKHIDLKIDQKEDKIQVLNKRLFEVESKTIENHKQQ